MTTSTTPMPVLMPQELLASDRLELGSIYTRNDLSVLFGIKDATLKNGIFRPKGFNSVWLFITENKTSDRTQYADRLMGEILHMQGQRLGRTDKLILDHLQQGLELLLFYRKKKYEHPYAGFRYEGIFNYQTHSGSTPTSFVLGRSSSTIQEKSLNRIEQQLKQQGEFNPDDLTDARIRIETSIVRRRGQSEFRKQLLSAYQGRCAITRCSLQYVLEAAHIHPYLGAETNKISNGLILRADVHTLFDLGMIWINPIDLRIGISDELKTSEYALLDGSPLHLPEDELAHPSRRAFEFRYHTLAKRTRP